MEERTYSLGYWIHRRRKALDLTQAGLASLVSCSPETIKKIERDERRPSLQIAELLADALVLKPNERTAFMQAVQKKVAVDHLTLDARPLEALPPALHSSLPASATPFIGRERELAEIAAWLADQDCRLLNLVGPGGAGKTRLALKAAEGRLSEYRHGACFVPLAGLENPQDLADTVLDHLRLPRSGSAKPQEQLLDYLRKKHFLLILDNFEHLLPETGLLIAILQAAPKVVLLVTSRQRLSLQSEWVYPVNGLTVPELEGGSPVESYSSGALFVQTARRQRAWFRVDEANRRAVTRICRQVEGMPLAIELAAAWIPVLEPEAIAAGIERGLDFLEAGLGDLPERQRSMRAVFDASWKLLSEDEQRAMEQLAVFRDSFNLAAAEAAFGIPPKRLLALVNKCWIQAGAGGRFQLHELVRQYARERSSAEAGAWERFKERHSAYFCGLLKAQGDWFCHREVEAITEIEADLHNIEAAWSWALEHGRADLVAGAVYSLGHYYDWSSRILAGKQAMQAAVNCLSAENIPAGIDPDSISLARARALTLLGSFSGGDQEKNQPYQEAGSLLDRLEQKGVDTRSERAYLLFHDAYLKYRQGPEVFRSLLGQSAAL
jgi:predicted ATPase/DNA-binding XRE family transcriptional regulator